MLTDDQLGEAIAVEISCGHPAGILHINESFHCFYIVSRADFHTLSGCDKQVLGTISIYIGNIDTNGFGGEYRAQPLYLKYQWGLRIKFSLTIPVDAHLATTTENNVFAPVTV